MIRILSFYVFEAEIVLDKYELGLTQTIFILPPINLIHFVHHCATSNVKPFVLIKQILCYLLPSFYFLLSCIVFFLAPFLIILFYLMHKSTFLFLILGITYRDLYLIIYLMYWYFGLLIEWIKLSVFVSVYNYLVRDGLTLKKVMNILAWCTLHLQICFLILIVSEISDYTINEIWTIFCQIIFPLLYCILLFLFKLFLLFPLYENFILSTYLILLLITNGLNLYFVLVLVCLNCNECIT